MHAEQAFAHTGVREAADFSSRVWVPFKAPLNPIGGAAAACNRLETPVGEPGRRHLLRQIARQVGI